jgi:hypothetical protein
LMGRSSALYRAAALRLGERAVTCSAEAGHMWLMGRSSALYRAAALRRERAVREPLDSAREPYCTGRPALRR